MLRFFRTMYLVTHTRYAKYRLNSSTAASRPPSSWLSHRGEGSRSDDARRNCYANVDMYQYKSITSKSSVFSVRSVFFTDLALSGNVRAVGI